MKLRLLSYHLSKDTPCYGDQKPLEIEYDKEISKGDSCNTAYIKISNHYGTHIDAPKHYFSDGMSISDYDISKLYFPNPYLLDCPKEQDELINPKDLSGITDCDLLLIRTGYFKHRGQRKYRNNNPGISPEAASWLRINKPLLKAIAIDSISISAFQKRESGREAHRIFLDKTNYPNDPIFLIEDADLSGDLRGLKKVWAIPLIIQGIDSMNCTLVGEF